MPEHKFRCQLCDHEGTIVASNCTTIYNLHKITIWVRHPPVVDLTEEEELTPSTQELDASSAEESVVLDSQQSDRERSRAYQKHLHATRCEWIRGGGASSSNVPGVPEGAGGERNSPSPGVPGTQEEIDTDQSQADTGYNESTPGSPPRDVRRSKRVLQKRRRKD